MEASEDYSPRREYITDDRDLPDGRLTKLIVFYAPNGDYYIGSSRADEGGINQVRICTSGGAASRNPALVKAVRAVFEALGGFNETATLTPAQVEVIRHTCMGSEKKKPRNYKKEGFYRNRFVTGNGSSDYAVCNQLVDQGYMGVRRSVEAMGGSDMFWLTDKGLAFADKEF